MSTFPDNTQIPSVNITSHPPSKQNVTLNEINFDNSALRCLPIDPIIENRVRQVSGACFSRVSPTPVKNPKLVSYSQEALNLLDIAPAETETQQFVDAFSGNTVLKGSDPAAHCYCGHQFGNFAGQLGDGRAMYLGEVLNSKNERWEMQLKGAGKTPYSRDADGRAVLRSSIREFLGSEALYHLGVPTTRAASLITSDSKVVRDLRYTGNPIEENVTVVLRLSPTFIRFGSFQITNGEDRTTGRKGPSAGKYEITKVLLDYTIQYHFPEVWKKYEDSQTRYAEFYREVVLRTANLVAEWQCVGFAHGVLNTDNMSILGITIDFGPFGFLDHYNPDFICNGSDHEGRYSFQNQPKICEWNLMKLAEAIKPHLPLDVSSPILALYYPEQKRRFYDKMRLKLGLLDPEFDEDRALIDSLLSSLTASGADFTNVMRFLSRVLINKDSTPEMDVEFSEMLAEDKRVLDYVLTQTERAAVIAKRHEPRIPIAQLQRIAQMAQMNPGILYMVGLTPESLRAEFKKHEDYETVLGLTDAEKIDKDKKVWRDWLNAYRTRIQKIPEKFQGESLLNLNRRRAELMNSNNPKFILRNYIAQNAIALAEKGDYSEVNNLLVLLRNPYDEGSESTAKYVSTIPDWAYELCVTCSS